MVPKPYDGETLRSKPSVSPIVRLTFSVLRPVALDDDPTLETDEIDDEPTERNLTAPFERRQPAIAQ
jgi:hypothetical protein